MGGEKGNAACAQQPLKRDAWEPRSRMIDGLEGGGRIKRMPESNSIPLRHLYACIIKCPVKTGAGVKRNELHSNGSDPYDIEYNLAPRSLSPCDEEDHFEYRRGGFLGICPWSGSSPGTTKTAEPIWSEDPPRENTTHVSNTSPCLVLHESDHLAPPLHQDGGKELPRTRGDGENMNCTATM